MESFILDQDDLENPMLETASKLLLSGTADGADLRTVDPETQARLEALLEAAGKSTDFTYVIRLLIRHVSIDIYIYYMYKLLHNIYITYIHVIRHRYMYLIFKVTY